VSRTDISGATYPLVIDQGDVTVPSFPRPQEWWRRYMPPWITVDVRDDGTVALDYDPAGSLAHDPGQELTPAELRRCRASMTRWINGDVLVRRYLRTEVLS